MRAYMVSTCMAVLVLILGARCQVVLASIMHQLLYCRDVNAQYVFNRAFGVLQSWSGCNGEEKHLLPLPGFIRRIYSYVGK